MTRFSSSNRKLDSIDVEDIGDVVRPSSMIPKWPGQKYCNCIHDTLPSTPGGKYPRNLVVCVDGTANQFNEKNTNVVELYHLLEQNSLQVTFYNSGIGTYATPSWKSWKQAILNQADLAFAWRFERIVLDAYEWICDSYEPGDRIFLFGFSRGAYQVRALSAMIHTVGLLHRGNDAQIPFAYELYRNSGPKSSTDTETFKHTFCRGDVKVHFVGVWDTVSSVGIVRSKTLPYTADGMTHVCFFRHALALHERRVKFLPEFARGGAGPYKNETETTSQSEMPHTKEVWFAGAHSDTGGGSIENKELKNNGPSLRWMTREAAATGLLLTPSSTKWSKTTKDVHESMNALWRILEILPIKRLSYKNGTHTTRNLVTGQLIHESVPWELDHKAMQKVKKFIEAQGPPGPDRPIELDDFGEVTGQILSTVKNLKNVEHRRSHLDGLRTMFGTFEARLALMNLSRDLYDETDHLFERQHFSRMPPVIKTLLHDDLPHRVKSAKTFLETFGTSEIFSIRRKGPITSFAFSLDGSRIACGTQSGGVFVRDVKTGKEVEMNFPTQGSEVNEHSGRVSDIAFSQDGSFVSVSWDRTIIVWSESGCKQTTIPPDIEGLPRSLAQDPNGQLAIFIVGYHIMVLPHPRGFMAGDGTLGADKSPMHSVYEHPSHLTSATFLLPQHEDTGSKYAEKVEEGGKDKGREEEDKESVVLVAVSGISDRVPWRHHVTLPWAGKEINQGLPTGSHNTQDRFRGQESRPLISHRNEISVITFSHDNSVIFTGSLDGSIGMWEIGSESNNESIAMWIAASGEQMNNVHAWSGVGVVAVKALAAYPQSSDRVVAGLGDGRAIVWEMSMTLKQENPLLYQWKGPPLRKKEFQYSGSGIMSIAYSPDGKRIAACNEEGLLVLWDADGPAGECIIEQLMTNDLWFPFNNG
ncbi:hypothetical protein VNI00_015892 [Paramarasmius palmivorus]|uniref:T6SS Phospholipase effector Tle1-like catalytic domain-containing protein n=1 Tax=Paramarasmius palmivorus TaxID=297713 RepID=A0AAW0BH76_9AGAR